MTKHWIISFFILVNLIYASPEIDNPKDPKTAFWFSLVPGMGQAYNGKWIKSALFIGLEIAAYESWKENKFIYNNHEQGNYPKSKYRYLEMRNKYAWWIGFIYVFGMIDAIVDAHLQEFEILMDSPIERQKKEDKNNAE